MTIEASGSIVDAAPISFRDEETAEDGMVVEGGKPLPALRTMGDDNTAA
jgi:hypothetical protein